MADHTLIPPVSGNRAIPRGRSAPASRGQQKHPPQPRKSKKSPGKKDDDRPSIDEYA